MSIVTCDRRMSLQDPSKQAKSRQTACSDRSLLCSSSSWASFCDSSVLASCRRLSQTGSDCADPRVSGVSQIYCEPHAGLGSLSRRPCSPGRLLGKPQYIRLFAFAQFRWQASMAYSMNWRPQLDEIAASSPESASPQPGTAPTSTSTVKPDPKPSSNGVYADNMNWRPPSPSSKAEEAETGAESVPYSESYPSEDNKASTFRACRATDCPVVRCIGESAYSCSIDGLVATLEAEGDDDWCLDLHPIRVHLTPAQILTLARVIYSCIYAAVCQNQVRTHLPYTMPLNQGSRISRTGSRSLVDSYEGWQIHRHPGHPTRAFCFRGSTLLPPTSPAALQGGVWSVQTA